MKRWIMLLDFAFVLIAVAGCAPADGGDLGSGPQAWIDAPRNNSGLPLGPVEIVSHAADQGGIALVEVIVNGTTLANLVPQDTQARLVTVRRMWEPLRPGNYRLQVRAQNNSGVWSDVAQALITIQGEAPQPVTATLTPTPLSLTPTLTSTATPTLTSTATRSLTSTASPTVVEACTNRARFVSDVTIPDDTVLAPGAPFTKTWRIRNDGTCTWDSDYALVFQGGDRMRGASPIALTGAVPPGSTVDLSVRLTAPTSPGTYRGLWMLQDDEARRFGIGANAATPFWLQIIVAVSPVPTRTSTPAPPDSLPPNVIISHSPTGTGSPTENDVVTFSVTASDNVGVVRIEIWVTPAGQGAQLVKTCNNQTSCVYQGGPYPVGELIYQAKAWDAAGNTGSSFPATIWIHAVPS